MKVPAIKKLVEQYAPEDLGKAEEALYEEQSPAIDVEGEDEGEQLTHILAARWILEKMNQEGVAFKDAMRQYTEKVRSSIN